MSASGAELAFIGKVTFRRGLREHYVKANALDLAKHLQANEKGLELSDEFDMMGREMMLSCQLFPINPTYAFECL